MTESSLEPPTKRLYEPSLSEWFKLSQEERNSIFERLPDEVIYNIMCYLQPIDAFQFAQTNSRMLTIFRDSTFQQNCIQPKLSIPYQMLGGNFNDSTDAEEMNLILSGTTRDFIRYQVRVEADPEKEWRETYATIIKDIYERIDPQIRPSWTTFVEKHYYESIMIVGRVAIVGTKLTSHNDQLTRRQIEVLWWALELAFNRFQRTYAEQLNRFEERKYEVIIATRPYPENKWPPLRWWVNAEIITGHSIEELQKKFRYYFFS